MTSATHSPGPADLTPDERQEILRRLRHGPQLPREELAAYARKVRSEVVSQREKVQR